MKIERRPLSLGLSYKTGRRREGQRSHQHPTQMHPRGLGMNVSGFTDGMVMASTVPSLEAGVCVCVVERGRGGVMCMASTLHAGHIASAPLECIIDNLTSPLCTRHGPHCRHTASFL